MAPVPMSAMLSTCTLQALPLVIRLALYPMEHMPFLAGKGRNANFFSPANGSVPHRRAKILAKDLS